MEGEGFLRSFKAGLAALRVQRNVPVKTDGVFRREMQVELLYVPYAEFLGEFRQVGFIRRALDAVLRYVRGQLVRAVAVFALDLMGDNDLGLVLSQQAGDEFARLVLSPALIGFLERAGVAVKEVAKDRVIAHAHVPQAVEQLAAAGGVGIGHAGNNDIVAAFYGIGWNRAAEEQQLVARMRGEQKQIRLVRRRLPALHPVGQLAFREEEDLVDLHLRLLASGVNQAEVRLAAEGNERVMVVRTSFEKRLPLAADILFNRPAVRHFAEADVEVFSGLILRQLKLHVGGYRFVGAEKAGIGSVADFGSFAAGGGDGAGSGEILSFLRICGASQTQGHQEDQRKNPEFFHRFNILPC